MKLTILGCGMAMPDLKRHMPGYVLEINGKKMLFDAGYGTVYQLLKSGIDLNGIENFFFSHFHKDHIMDLPVILWVSKNHYQRKGKMEIYGPPGIREHIDMLFEKIVKKRNEVSFPLNVHELKEGSRNIAELKFDIRKMIHPETIGFRIESGGKILVYTADTAPFPGLSNFCRDADLLVCECSWTEGNKEDHNANNDHMRAKDCGKLAKEANVKRIVLTHFYPQTDEKKAKEIVESIFEGEVIIARDMMALEF